ncbi:MAG TPA: hypothetical protein VKX49_13445 [Bryobacteraceae bacterium]|nr:hypothetical protein [Bryobacteraceae bacterium]
MDCSLFAKARFYGYAALAAIVIAVAVPGAMFADALQISGTGGTICEQGTCVTPDTLLAGSSLAKNFDFFYTLANGDQYEFVGTVNESNTSTFDFSLDAPFNVVYRGNTSNPSAASQSDTLTFDILQNVNDTNASGQGHETVRGSFAGGIASTSSVQGELFVAGQNIGLLGPFLASGGAFSQSIANVTVSGLTDPVLYDQRRIFSFASGSLVGADIVNGTASPVPEPAAAAPVSMLILVGALAYRRRRSRTA